MEVKNLGAYVSAGQGMGVSLQMAGELGAYALPDRAAWLTREDSPLVIPRYARHVYHLRPSGLGVFLHIPQHPGGQGDGEEESGEIGDDRAYLYAQKPQRRDTDEQGG